MSDKKKVPAPHAATRQSPAPAKKSMPPVPTPAPKGGGRADDFSRTPVASPSVTSPAPRSTMLTKSPPRLIPKGFNPWKIPGGDQDPGGPLLTLSPDFFKPLPGEDKIDWAGMELPFLRRGIPVTDRDIDMIEANWRFTYNWAIQLGLGREIAAKAANFGTPFAYDTALQRDFPDTDLRLTRTFDKLLPPGQSMPSVIPATAIIDFAVKPLLKRSLFTYEF